MDTHDLSVESPTGILAFARSVCGELVSYALFGFGAAVVGVWSTYEGRPPWWLVATVAVVGGLLAAYRPWQKERAVRNAQAKRLGDLSRPFFVTEIQRVYVDALGEGTSWITLGVLLVIRNQGADSAVDRWTLKIVPPFPGTPSILTAGEGGLVDSPDADEHNLLHDPEIIKRGGLREGCLLYKGDGKRLGLKPGQRPFVKVSFRDIHGRMFSVTDPPGVKVDFFSD